MRAPRPPRTGGASRFRLSTAETARAVLRRFRPLGTEVIPVTEAAGRVLARGIRATLDLPHFTRSYMDGYAVRATDTASGRARLRIIGTVTMGRGAPCGIARAETLRVPTGGMLPPGADAVVMTEHAREHPDGTVEITHAAAPGENVMQRGEDVRRGQLVFERGRRLRAADVGALSGVGTSRLLVYRRPRVAVIATGDEIVSPDVTPGPGQVRNVNQYALRAMIVAAGGQTVDLGVVPDRRPLIARALARAIRSADLVLVSGGSSVGTKDLTPVVIAAMPKARMLVHGIQIKPGKPTLVARIGGKPVVGLPGNPTSALVIFELFAAPLVRRLGGEPAERMFVPPRQTIARLGRPLTSQLGREDWLRVILTEHAQRGLIAQPAAGGSGDIVSFVRADGMVCVPPETSSLPAGATVQVHLF